MLTLPMQLSLLQLLSAVRPTQVVVLAVIALAAAALNTSPAVAAAPDSAERLPVLISEHWQLVTGTWCGPYLNQTPVAWTPPPRGDKACPSGCEGKGWCDYDTGQCQCRAGWGGASCGEPRPRPCALMGPDRRDQGWHSSPQWMHSRCAGLCDDEVGMCYCPPETKYGWKGSGQGNASSPALGQARPMYWCQPSDDDKGVAVKWGAVKYSELLGPDGWCNADIPSFRCPCRVDGVAGDFCHIKVEQTCPNQCGGHGDCLAGFCLCHDGYYGHDCSRMRKALTPRPGLHDQGHHWLTRVMQPLPSTGDVEPPPTRKRPFIYVYDLPGEMSSWFLQYRIERGNCVHRLYGIANQTSFSGNTYMLDSLLHELMLTSEHRTWDPDEADYFYVPHYAVCFIQTLGHNHYPEHPTLPTGPRPFHISYILLEIQRWLQAELPYWNRTGGADHIWFMAHDEGACYAPKEVWPSVILTHWGRMDFPHFSGSQYHADNYSCEMRNHRAYPQGWLANSSKSHPCYDPVKDLVLPAFKPPLHYARTPFMGRQQLPAGRDILLFFKGDVARHRGDTGCVYSRCIRQRLLNISREQNWTQAKAFYGDSLPELEGGYSELLQRSQFCLVLPGDGWSPRMEDAMLHGCVPVIIQDEVHVPFESLLDMERFSLRLPQSALTQVLATVQAVTPERLQELQAGVAKLWHRFRWSSGVMVTAEVKQLAEYHLLQAGGQFKDTVPGRQFASSATDDAFSTLIQWLYARIPFTRKAQPMRFPERHHGT